MDWEPADGHPDCQPKLSLSDCVLLDKLPLFCPRFCLFSAVPDLVPVQSLIWSTWNFTKILNFYNTKSQDLWDQIWLFILILWGQAGKSLQTNVQGRLLEGTKLHLFSTFCSLLRWQVETAGKVGVGQLCCWRRGTTVAAPAKSGGAGKGKESSPSSAPSLLPHANLTVWGSSSYMIVASKKRLISRISWEKQYCSTDFVQYRIWFQTWLKHDNDKCNK